MTSILSNLLDEITLPDTPAFRKKYKRVAAEIDRLSGEVSRLDKLSRAQAMMINTMSEDDNAYRHFECATIINTMKSKADALAEAVENLQALKKNYDPKSEMHAALYERAEHECRAALTAYRGK